MPTVFENSVKEHIFEGVTYQLQLWDTAGQEDYDRLRPLSYPDANLVIVCVSADMGDSFDNVDEKWYPEVSQFCPSIPKILVCCKIDLVEKNREFLKNQKEKHPERSDESITSYMKSHYHTKFARYLTCSSKTGEGVIETFEEAIQLLRNNTAAKRCMIL